MPSVNIDIQLIAIICKGIQPASVYLQKEIPMIAGMNILVATIITKTNQMAVGERNILNNNVNTQNKTQTG